MALLDVSGDNMIQNDEGNRVRGGGRGRGLRGGRAPGGAVRGARKLDGHPCRGPLGMRGVRVPGGGFRYARRLDGHLCGGPPGMRGVRGPGGTFGGARQLDGHPRRGPLGFYAITKTTHGTRNLPWQNRVLEDRFKAVGSSGVESGTKLQLTNLNAGVSNEDIRTLFSEIGELIRYGIHYDKDGNPCGSAEVVFARSSDAFEAVKRYNNSDLDGKPMKIEKVGSIVRAHVASRLNMIGKENGRRTAHLISSSRMAHGGAPIRGRGGRGGGRGHGGFGRRAVEKSAEELDKELENYQAETRQT